MTEKIYWPESSYVDNTEFNPDENHMDVTLKNGQSIRYLGFSLGDWDELKAAPSVGKHIHARVKNNFRYVPLNQPKDEPRPAE